MLSGIVNKKSWWVNAFYLMALLYFSYLMLLITLQYVPFKQDAAFLRTKFDVVHLQHYRIAFIAHVYTSFWVLLAGAFQFSKYLRKHYSAIHRNIGKLYILIILTLAGPGGLIMGYYANGGPIAQVSFCMLSILWWYFTFKAYQTARLKQWHLHRAFMYRSYALTLSAISLRVFKLVIVALFHPNPMDVYVLVAWLGWVVNLGIAEFLIYRLRVKRIGIA
jgi:uncharacterized membrane protein